MHQYFYSSKVMQPYKISSFFTRSPHSFSSYYCPESIASHPWQSSAVKGEVVDRRWKITSVEQVRVWWDFWDLSYSDQGDKKQRFSKKVSEVGFKPTPPFGDQNTQRSIAAKRLCSWVWRLRPLGHPDRWCYVEKNCSQHFPAIFWVAVIN